MRGFIVCRPKEKEKEKSQPAKHTEEQAEAHVARSGKIESQAHPEQKPVKHHKEADKTKGHDTKKEKSEKKTEEKKEKEASTKKVGEPAKVTLSYKGWDDPTTVEVPKLNSEKPVVVAEEFPDPKTAIAQRHPQKESATKQKAAAPVPGKTHLSMLAIHP